MPTETPAPNLERLKAEAKAAVIACAWREDNGDDEEIERLGQVLRDIAADTSVQWPADRIMAAIERPERARITVTVGNICADWDVDDVLALIDSATRVEWLEPSIWGGHELGVVAPRWPNGIRVAATRSPAATEPAAVTE